MWGYKVAQSSSKGLETEALKEAPLSLQVSFAHISPPCVSDVSPNISQRCEHACVEGSCWPQSSSEHLQLSSSASVCSPVLA